MKFVALLFISCVCFGYVCSETVDTWGNTDGKIVDVQNIVKKPNWFRSQTSTFTVPKVGFKRAFSEEVKKKIYFLQFFGIEIRSTSHCSND